MSGRVTTSTLHACSACAGDYEDPERSAWREDELDEAKDDEAPGAESDRRTRNDFPVRPE